MQQQLAPNTLLQGGRYRIERILGQGGFGITYLAIQCGLDRKVAIKEFFMKELCERDESTSNVTLGTEGSRETVNRFREKFKKEARNIARLSHQNIVRINDVFEENNTVYYVMEYAENGSLADKVKREGYLSEPVATRYILQVAAALDYIHKQKMNHLDVKPGNIMINEKDEAVLIDFGLSKQYDTVTDNQTSMTPVGVSEGYAPMEQYMQGGLSTFSPETDIYSLGATYYKLLTGITPPNASSVNNEGLPIDELKAKGTSKKAIDVICKSMEVRKKDRMRDVCAFVNSLDNNINDNEIIVNEEIEVLDDEGTEIITDVTQNFVQKYGVGKILSSLLAKSTDVVVVPKGVRIIEQQAFKGNRDIQKVVLPEGVVEIGDQAFYKCESLKQITLPSTLRKIGDFAFWGTGLETVVIPEGLEKKGFCAFGVGTTAKKATPLPEDTVFCHDCGKQLNDDNSIMEISKVVANSPLTFANNYILPYWPQRGKELSAIKHDKLKDARMLIVKVLERNISTDYSLQYRFLDACIKAVLAICEGRSPCFTEYIHTSPKHLNFWENMKARFGEKNYNKFFHYNSGDFVEALYKTICNMQ